MSNLVDPKTIAQNFWSNLTPADFSAPIVSIGQPTGGKGTPGNFIFNSGDQKPALLNCKLLHVKKGRVLYSSKFKSLCGSSNFYKPDDRYGSNRMSDDCMSCALSHWDPSDRKAEVDKQHGLGVKDFNKPMCNETYNLLMADDKCNPFFISFQKTQLKVVSEKLLSRLKGGFSEYCPFHVSFDMTLDKVQGSGKSYYNVAFGNFNPIPVESPQFEEMRGLWSAWNDKASEVLSRQYEESDAQYESGEKTVGNV